MRWTFYCRTLILLVFSAQAFGQQAGIQWFLSPNINLYFPVNTPHKGTYPVLWYDKEASPKVLIGGFGFGVSGLKQYREKVILKGQANLSRQTYWDEPFMLIDDGGGPIADYLSASADYVAGITATAHYRFTGSFSAGTGLGGQVLLASLTRLPPDYLAGSEEKQVAANRYYKRIMPVVPVELSLKLEKMLFNVRYEYGLLNRLKGELSEYQRDKFGLLTFEVGFRLK